MSIQVDAVFDDVASLNGFANSTTPNTIWQSFTSGSALYLYGVQLFGKTPDTIINGQPISATGINITIYNGTGTGGSIFATLTAADVPATGPNWISFPFPSPYTTLTPGNIYTIAIGGPGGEDFLWGYSFVSPTSSYPGGEASFQPPSDLFFKVEVIPVPSNPNIPNTFTLVEVEDGTAAAPSYTFINDLTTGLYRSTGPSSLSVTVAGVQHTRFEPGITAPNGVISLGTAISGGGGYSDIFLNPAGFETFFEDFGLDLPIIRASGADPVMTYLSQDGRVIRIGTLLFISGRIEWTGFAGGAGNLFVESTVNRDIIGNNIMSMSLSGFTYPAGASPYGEVQNALAPVSINLMCNITAAAPIPVTIAMLPAAGAIIYTGVIQQRRLVF
jgi:hypothetical protein